MRIALIVLVTLISHKLERAKEAGKGVILAHSEAEDVLVEYCAATYYSFVPWQEGSALVLTLIRNLNDKIVRAKKTHKPVILTRSEAEDLLKVLEEQAAK